METTPIPIRPAAAGARGADRLPPQNEDAERAILGAILLERDALGLAVEKVGADDFYRKEHRLIFAAMRELYDHDQAIDSVTVAETLQRREELEECGGRDYLGFLLATVATAANISYHAGIVKEKAVLRGLITAATNIAGEAFEGAEPAATILDRAQTSIYKIAESTRKGGFELVRSVVPVTFRTIEEAFRNKSDVTGLRTGFADFDRLTAGLQKSDLIVLAARPSMGKTALALNLAYNVAVKEQTPVAIFSLEMAKEQLVMRMLCSSGGFNNHDIRRGQIQPQDWPRLTAACERLAAAPIYIDDTSSLSALEMKAKARLLKKQAHVGLIIVDYLQLMTGHSRSENRQQEISDISRNLKALAKDLEVPVMALSQLSRAVESRGDNKPKLSDLRECVTGDTLVALADGRRLPIRDLVGQEPEVLSVNEVGRLSVARSDKVWRVGRRPVFTVKLASGRQVRATADHRLFGERGWVRVGELAPGDRLAMAANGVSHRAMAEARGTAYGGSAHFNFSPSRELLRDYADLLQDDDLGAKATSDLFWDRVIGVEAAGEEDVFDLTVPDTACWLADGILSHNSGAIEQDADVVMFIYREEMYNPEDESVRNLATVIIGKQRNGPTGDFQLHFNRQCTRFDNLQRQQQT